MATDLTPALARDLREGLTGICTQIGVDPGSATLVKYTMNAVFHADPYVVRMAQGPTAVALATQVTAVAAALSEADIPTVRLAPHVEPQPVRHGDWVATVWRHVPTVNVDPRPIDLAAPLRAIHALVGLEVALPAWSPIEKFRRRLSTAENGLSQSRAADLTEWSLTEFGCTFAAVISLLRDRCDQLEESLGALRWQLTPGVIHADAHTGNVLLHANVEHPLPAGRALLCDLDGVSIGPREWDLVPTAHGVTRFGRAAGDYRAFADAYGFDITAWDGWPVLREIRELQLITSVIDSLAGRPSVTRQFAYRLRSLIDNDQCAVWARYS
jgi:hypothetical protein